MKKYFKMSLLVVLMIILTFNGFALAASNDNTKNKVTININEYIHLKQLKEKTDSDLKELGYSENEITEIRNFDYAEKLRERSKLDKNTLHNLGYTEDQINKLKNFSGTEEEIIALASLLDLTAETVYFQYNSSENKTYFRVKWAWQWSAAPFEMDEDIIAIGWDPNMYIDTSTAYTYHKVRYRNYREGNTFYKSKSVDPVAASGAAQSTWDMCINVSSQPLDYDWSDYGYGYIRLSKVGRVSEAAMKISYGHSTVDLAPGIGYPFNIGFSIVPDSCKEYDYEYIHEEL
ncbi:MAG: hypothetical protein NUV45_13070 [Tepidanaerobacteraceae bacterium]|nr:hypothetical protein [Tepidanaerobacteraceae bacterium]